MNQQTRFTVVGAGHGGKAMAAVLEIVTELERIDDYARGIAPSFINCRTIKGLWINQVLTKSTYCDIIYIELLYIN